MRKMHPNLQRCVTLLVIGALISFMSIFISSLLFYIPSDLSGKPPEYAPVHVVQTGVDEYVSHGRKVELYHLWIKLSNGDMKKVDVQSSAYQLAQRGMPVQLEKHISDLPTIWGLRGLALALFGSLLIMIAGAWHYTQWLFDVSPEQQPQA